jgi:hypothetical protein
MLFNTQHYILAALLPTLAVGLPYNIVPRAKSYEIINVDGGQSTQAPPPPPETTIVEATKTVEVQTPGPTVTQEVTTIIVSSAPAPTSDSSSPTCTSSTSESWPLSASMLAPVVTNSTSSTPTAIETPKPVFVTVTVPKDNGTTQYYDNGMWHTRYPIKSFEPAVVTPTTSTTSALIATPTS